MNNLTAARRHLFIAMTNVPAPKPDPLLATAKRLWPDNEHNQREWLRAVSVVRCTRTGWPLEHRVERRV